MKELFKLLKENTSEKGSYSLDFNQHKTYYETPEQYYSDELNELENKDLDLSKDIYCLCWYKKTPVGSYTILANSLEDIYKRVLGIMKEGEVELEEE
jgi:hypothetical protein